MIDLHLHSTASDGRLSPADLVRTASAAGLSILSLTDHDTTAGLEQAQAEAAALGLTFVTGIEITAVEQGRDIHVLGYFFDAANVALREFLRTQRVARLRRVGEMGARLETLGFAVDIGPIVQSGARGSGRSVGRPQVADALVAAGHARDRRDAFDRLLGQGRPGFVPRLGPTVADVVAMVHRAGGIASMAHPGLVHADADIPRFVAAGLDALEARHSDHDGATEMRYRRMAADLGVLVSGGSDFHADPSQHAGALGVVTLGAEDFAALQAHARLTVRDR